MKRGAKKKATKKRPTNGRRRRTGGMSPPTEPARPREKKVERWMEADDHEQALLEEVSLLVTARVKDADESAARRVTELGLELRQEMRSVIGSAMASLPPRQPKTMAYRLARALIDLLEEAEAGAD